MELKLRAWDGHKMQYNFRIDSDDGMAILNQFCVDGDIGTLVPHYKVMLSTGFTGNSGDEIWFGDVWYVAGYGNLHIESFADIATLIDSLAENDVERCLGNVHANPELITK